MTLSQLQSIIQLIRNVDPHLPIQALAVFLQVAQVSKTSVTELTSTLKISKSQVSRHVRSLTTTSWTGKPGCGLLQVDWVDGKHKVITLTQKGKNLLKRII